MVDSDGMVMNHLSINSTGHQHQAGLIPTGYHAIGYHANGQLAEAHIGTHASLLGGGAAGRVVCLDVEGFGSRAMWPVAMWPVEMMVDVMMTDVRQKATIIKPSSRPAAGRDPIG